MSASLEQENEVIETTENNDSPVQTVDIALASEPGLDRDFIIQSQSHNDSIQEHTRVLVTQEGEDMLLRS